MSWESSIEYYRFVNEATRDRQGGLHCVLADEVRLVDGGAEAILLGCTEIELLVGPDEASVPTFDTTRLHAERAVELALEPARA